MIDSYNTPIGSEPIDKIYISLIAMICTGPLLSWAISNTTILRTIELLFFLIAIGNLYRLKKQNELVSFTGVPRLLIFALSVILVYILLRGTYPSDPKNLILFIIGNCIICLLPFLLLFLPNYKYQERIFRIFYYGSLIYLPLVIVNINTGLILVNSDYNWAGETIGASMAFFAAFLVGLMSNRFSKKEKCMLILIWSIYFILMLLNARRNVCFTLVVYMVVAYFYNSFKNNGLSAKIVSVVSVGLIALFIMLNFQNFAVGPFKAIYNRSTEDTRSQVEQLLLADFATSPIEDWIWGRGFDGGYYQEMIDINTGEIETNRKIIETGYLNMMLKGGIIFDIVVVLLVLIAIKRSFSINDNDSYYLGLILITYLIDNYTTNPIYIFNSRSILFWFMISLLLSDREEDASIIED